MNTPLDGGPAFPTITIHDPAAIAEWIDKERPGKFPTRVSYTQDGRFLAAYCPDGDCLFPTGKTPNELMACLIRQIEEADPVAKLRKQAKELGHELIEINPVRS